MCPSAEMPPRLVQSAERPIRKNYIQLCDIAVVIPSDSSLEWHFGVWPDNVDNVWPSSTRAHSTARAAAQIKLGHKKCSMPHNDSWPTRQQSWEQTYHCWTTTTEKKTTERASTSASVGASAYHPLPDWTGIRYTQFHCFSFEPDENLSFPVPNIHFNWNLRNWFDRPTIGFLFLLVVDLSEYERWFWQCIHTYIHMQSL